eukprot:363403-Chlamydomonas_euryale.AAC.20
MSSCSSRSIHHVVSSRSSASLPASPPESPCTLSGTSPRHATSAGAAPAGTAESTTSGDGPRTRRCMCMSPSTGCACTVAGGSAERWPCSAARVIAGVRPHRAGPRCCCRCRTAAKYRARMAYQQHRQRLCVPVASQPPPATPAAPAPRAAAPKQQ